MERRITFLKLSSYIGEFQMVHYHPMLKKYAYHMDVIVFTRKKQI